MIRFKLFGIKKIIIVLFICLPSVAAMAQSSDTSFRHLPVAKVDRPLFIINNQIIIGTGNEINPSDIESINVIKQSSGISASLKNLNKYGIIFITLKGQVLIKTKSFKQIKEWMDVTEPVKFAVDGFFVDDDSLLIATSSITEINIFKNTDDQGKLTDTVINIWTLTPEDRKAQVPGKRLSTDKPGVIYIR